MRMMNLESRDCMLRKCESCEDNGKTVREFLEGKFEDLNETISYREWTCVDRTNLITQSMEVLEIIDLLVEKLEQLAPVAPHSFIYKSQSNYLKNQKESLGEVLCLLDFSENFSFHIQDEVQGFRWTHSFIAQFIL